MAIEYEFHFNYSDTDGEFSNYLKTLPNFHKYDKNDFAFIYKKPENKNSEAVIKLTDSGLHLIDYLTSIGRDLIGIIVEYVTGISDNVIIEEKDKYL